MNEKDGAEISRELGEISEDDHVLENLLSKVNRKHSVRVDRASPQNPIERSMPKSHVK